MNEIKLPPWPEDTYIDAACCFSSYCRVVSVAAAEAYTRAAIEADRQARGEPVAWTLLCADLQSHITTLRAYQAWRTGDDNRSLFEAGIAPTQISAALNALLDLAENHLRGATKKVGSGHEA